MMMTSPTSLRSIPENYVKRILLGSLLLAGLTACQAKKEAPLQIPTAVAMKRSITVTADATGKIEPINVVDIKSKAGGQIIAGPPETGTHMMPGDLIVDLDKKDVNSAFEQANADLTAAKAKLENSKALQKQNEALFASNVITKREKEASDLDVTNQSSSLIRAQQALELAQQRVNDATIKAPIEGTVLNKLVSTGTVIASASNSASGGTTLIQMANLARVRARVLVSETDIGKVQVGMTTTVLVDAYPNKPFTGVVEKMEPQAVVDQNVTMFPVLVSLANEEGALMPGMNGEVSILVEEKRGALSIPLDAFRLANEAGIVAEMFGVTKEAVDSVARAGPMMRSTPSATTGDDSASQVPVGRGTLRRDSTSGRGGSGGTGSGRGGMQQGGSGGQGGRGAPVTDEQCKGVTDAIAKATGLKKQLDDLSAQMMDPNADGRAIRTQRTTLIEKAGIDPQVYSSCQRQQLMSGNGASNGRGGRGGGRGGNGGGGRGSRGGAGGAGAIGNLGQRNMGLGVRGQGLAQQGIVFVKVSEDTLAKPPKVVFEPRFVRLGSQNYDYAEVVEGLKEGEVVALMAAAKIELTRRQAADRQKSMTSLIPGAATPGRGGPGMGGPGGGGGRGGRGG